MPERAGAWQKPSSAAGAVVTAAFHPPASPAARHGLVVDVVRLGAPELPWLGPFALVAAAAALVAAGDGPAAVDGAAVAVVRAACAGAAILVTAAGLCVGFARLDVRSRGVAGGVGGGFLRASLSRAAPMALLLTGACAACAGPALVAARAFDVPADLAAGDAAARFTVLLACAVFLGALALVVGARLLVAAPLLALDRLGPGAAVVGAWGLTEDATWALTWRAGLGAALAVVVVLAVRALTLAAAAKAGASLGAGGAAAAADAAAFLVVAGVVLPLAAAYAFAVRRRLAPVDDALA